MRLNSVVHDFRERLAFSANLSDEPAWIEFYRRLFPDAISIIRLDAATEWQRSGVDRLIVLPNLQQIYVDEKKRSKNYGDFHLEEWSVWELPPGRSKIGWTLDATKRCDYVAYCVPADNGHSSGCYFLPFIILREACACELAKWKQQYQKCVADSGGWKTLGWAIPWDELFKAMKRVMFRRWGEQMLALGAPIREVSGKQLTFFWSVDKTSA